MSDYDRILVLRARLTEIERKSARPCERSVVEIARIALETELSELGRRMSRRDYWRGSQVVGR